MSRIYCESLERPIGFEGIKLFHGFNAFFARRTYEENFYDLLAHPEYQICTSTKYLGMLGVIVEGDVILASSYDLFSGIDKENGKRYFDEKDLKHIVYDYKDLELHEDDDEENNEIVVQNTKATAIWITEDAPNKLKAIAKKLSEESGLPIVQVGMSIFY